MQGAKQGSHPPLLPAETWLIQRGQPVLREGLDTFIMGFKGLSKLLSLIKSAVIISGGLSFLLVLDLTRVKNYSVRIY